MGKCATAIDQAARLRLSFASSMRKKGTRSVIIKVRVPEYCIVKSIIRQAVIAISRPDLTTHRRAIEREREAQ